MTYKKQVIFFFIYAIACTVFIALFNYAIDPFQQYRKSTFYQAPYIFPRFLNAGMAKNFSYDSLIIGTSLTENFRLQEVTDILSFPKPIKLSVGGGSIFDEATILKTAIHSGQVKKVLFGFDIFCLKADPDAYPLPGYLYDDNVFNDYDYIFNLDTLKRSLIYPFFQFVFKNHPRMDYMRMFEWQHNVPKGSFNASRVMKAYWIAQSHFQADFSKRLSSYQYMRDNFDHVILPIIKQDRMIQYIIFFPPYSILEHKLLAENKQLENYLKIKTYISEQLLQLDNVALFDFQEESSITEHLDNYMDRRHYHQKINHWMLEQIRNGHDKVTNPQGSEILLRNQVMRFKLPEHTRQEH